MITRRLSPASYHCIGGTIQEGRTLATAVADGWWLRLRKSLHIFPGPKKSSSAAASESSSFIVGTGGSGF